MLIHCVFLNPRSEADIPELMDAMRELAALVPEVEGMEALSHGRNVDYENKTPDHPLGFVVTFRDRAAHLRYEAHPRHVAAGARMVAACAGGADGIAVYDIETD